MNKKIIGMICVVFVIVLLSISAPLFLNQSDKKKNSNNEGNISDTKKDNDEENQENNGDKVGKVLVVYYSATNNTKGVAEKIAQNLNADIFELVPVQEYTSEDLSYGNSNSRVSKEHNDERLRNVELKNTTVENWESYDTILIGYPIWWGIAAWPVNSFITSNDFNGKTVIPFCTSASSGLGESGTLLAQKANGGDWKEGHRFSSRPSDSDIKIFTDNIR